jgi:predicted deacylase
MEIPTLDETRRFFDRFRNETLDGVEGVVRFDTGKPGPVLGVTACTHGNEPAGLAALKHLLDIRIGERLRRGTLYLVANNLRATERYFDTFDIRADEERSAAKRKARFIDRNMNRLPETTLTGEDSDEYEVVRARTLAPIWRRFTIGFDIHTTSEDSPPMMINGRNAFRKALVRGFPASFNVVISNIDAVQIGMPASGFYGGVGSDIPVFLIEAGAHENPASFRRATECVLALLRNLGMIEGATRRTADAYKEYVVDASVVFPDASYALTNVLPNFGPVRKGDVLATGNGADIAAPFDGHALFCSQRTIPDSIAEEVMFLSRPARILES